MGCGEPRREFLNGPDASTTTTLYLNFEQWVYVNVGVEDATRGFSTLVSDQTVFRGYREGDPSRGDAIRAITDEIADLLSPYAIRVTRDRPDQGSYHMIQFTDDDGHATGCASCISRAPKFCEAASPQMTGFVFAASSPPQHVITSQVVSIVAMFGGLPTSSQPGDCLCYANTDGCIAALTNAACTIGGANTPVSTTQICPTTKTTMDEHAEMLAAFGAK
jgi:hypothetical protein